MTGIQILIAAAIFFAIVIAIINNGSNDYSLNGIKGKTVGNGQHGTAKFADKKEIRDTYRHIPFEPEKWRTNEKIRPKTQGLIVGCKGEIGTTALVDDADIHALMVGAAGVGKTAYFLYPNIEYACACGMSFLSVDTKGDIYRNYGNIAQKYYGYKVSVIDLRNPSKSDGNNLLHLVNKYMDLYEQTKSLAYKAKSEKYAKIIAKTIILSGSESASFGQNAFFYDAAEGLLTSAILIIAEFAEKDERHIISVFKLIQDLFEPSRVKGKTKYKELLEKLPNEHKARWFAGSAVNTGEQAMMSVMSTAMSRLNAFLDSELEQILCFDTAIDAEEFCRRKSAVFIVLPEEDNTKYFMVSLIIQQLYREILTVADENGGTLNNRVMFFIDEMGTIPKIDSAEMMFSASRSRKISIVAIIQSFAQLEKNYGVEGAEIIVDNCQDVIFGGFAPNSQSAEKLSKALGSKTVLSGSVSKGKNDPSKTLQMMERALMTPDELKAMPKGHFIVMKTGHHPMQVVLKLFFKWGIRFEDEKYTVKESYGRAIKYADKAEIEANILKKYAVKKQYPDFDMDLTGNVEADVSSEEKDSPPKSGYQPKILYNNMKE